jgi:hypothetical protein
LKIELEFDHDALGLPPSYAVTSTSIESNGTDTPAFVRDVRTWVGGTLHLTVDHAYYTAKQSVFEIGGDNPELVANLILAAAQNAVIKLQTDTFVMLASVNAAVINSLDDSEIVHNVLREVMNVLPHCDAGVFRLFDEKTGLLVPVSHTGLPDDYTDYRLEPNESVSGEVFSTGRPVIHNGRQQIIDAHRVMRPASQAFMERSHIANALLCVPVMAEGKCLGTLTTLCFSLEGAFSVFDRLVLESLAAQIAVAYQRSLAYQNAIATSQRLEEMGRDLLRKNVDLDRAVELHETLLRIFSTGKGLIDQLQAVTKLFQVEFRFDNVLGNEYVSPGWTDQDGVLTQSVEVAEAPIGHFYFNSTEDQGFTRALFGTLAAFVAVDFVRDISQMDVVNAVKKAHFDSLCNGTETVNKMSRFGFRSDRFSQIVVVNIPRISGDSNAQLSIHKMQSDLSRTMTAQNALVFHDDEQIVLLLSAATATSLDRSVRAICDAADDLAIFAGASNIYDTSAGHLSARSHAAQAAEALSRRGRYGLMRHRDMGIELLLQSRGRKDVLDFTLQILGPLLQDARNRSLYDTLLRYVRESKAAARTAEALQIHTNTLYQRLQRIETLIGYDLGNAESFTLLSLACQLHSDYMENGL